MIQEIYKSNKSSLTASRQNSQPKIDRPKIPIPSQLFSEKDILTLLLNPKKHVTSAPTHTPRNFYEQIVFYDDTTNQRIYIYLNGNWKYVALT